MSLSMLEVRQCTKCKGTFHEYIELGNTRAVLCRACERVWLVSPESTRLRMISESLFSEWVERLRCEAIVHAAPNAGQGEGS